jgi:hypothetical protein
MGVEWVHPSLGPFGMDHILSTTTTACHASNSWRGDDQFFT